MWGLYACEAGSPTAAGTAFRLARPTGGRRVLALRRLAAVLERADTPSPEWLAAATADWSTPQEQRELLLAHAQALLRRGRVVEAATLARRAMPASGPERGRALLVLARAGDGQALAELALDFPTLLVGGELPPLASLSASFTAADWRRHAAAWLASGRAREALTAARRAGAVAALEGAQASVRLRQPNDALAWARRLERDSPHRLLVEAEAYRQLAWRAGASERRRHFEACAQAARGAATDRQAVDRGAAGLLAAEALAELGRFREAGEYLEREEVRRQPRFEWVFRRYLFLQATRGVAPPARELETLGRTTRGRRLARFWAAVRGGAAADGHAVLEELAGAGFVDLPALWAASRLGGAVPALRFAEQDALLPPPLWSRDLLRLGRLADVLVGFRADLEHGWAPSRGWLTLVSLAELPPSEAIPLLVRGEPRLVTGQWQGLPRPLMEKYLPLPRREELELAAARAAVPPWLLAGLVRQESAWVERAVSAAGAVGLAQVLPATARELVQQRRDLAAVGNDFMEPATNLTVGGLLLARWRHAFGGSWVAALAAYNAGERRVRATWEEAGRRDGPEFVEALEIPETWDYVHRVVMLAEGYRALYWPGGRGYPWT